MVSPAINVYNFPNRVCDFRSIIIMGGDDQIGFLNQVYKLRHLVVRKILKWLPPAPNGLDKDSYDMRNTTVHFGVVNNSGRLNAYFRAVVSDKLSDYMMGHEFISMFFDSSEKKDDVYNSIQRFLNKTVGKSAELSRYVFRPGMEKSEFVTSRALLYRTFIQWTLGKIRYVYLVSTREIYESLTDMGFSIELIIAKPMVARGDECTICRLDLSRSELQMKKTNPENFIWFWG